MHAFFSILLFACWKSLNWFALQYGIGFFHLRNQSILLYFYLIISGVQLLYVLWNVFFTSQKKRSVFLSFFSFTTVLMESAIFLTLFLFLTTLENSPVRLSMVFAFLSPSFSYYFLFQQGLNRLLINDDTQVDLPPKAPWLVPLFYNLIFPAVIAGLLVFLQPNLQSLPLAQLLFWCLLHASIVGIGMAWDRLRLVLGLARQIRQLSPFLLKPVVSPKANNEIGWIEQEIHRYEIRKKETYHEKTFISQYLSQEMKKEILKKGLPSKAQEITATVSTIRFDIKIQPTEESLLIDVPSDPMEILDKIIQIVGNYAEQYQAYPIFSHHQIHLIFGAPVYFEYLNYHALECSAQIINDLEQMTSEVIKIHRHCGIIHGKLYMGTLHSRGKDYRDLEFAGDAMLQSEQLANAAYQANIDLLTNEACIKDLKTKFFVEKNYRVQLDEETEIIASKIRT